MTKPTFAHFPGGGPSGATCAQCGHFGREAWNPSGRLHQWCGLAQLMTGQEHTHMGRLNSATAACKKFEAAIPNPERLMMSGAIKSF